MDRRPVNRRTSSQREISAFGQSFSCGEFGAFDLDLDEDDYEAMALQAELEAQERINKARGRDAVIDGLLEGEEDVSLDRKEFKPDLSPPRGTGMGGMAQLKDSRDNKSKRWEPQKIVEDDGEEGALTQDDVNVCPLDRMDSHHSDQASVHNSANNRSSSWEKASAPNTVVKTDENSGIVLAATPESIAHNGGIKIINAPNVTINYIIEQKVESRAAPARLGREYCDVSENESYLWAKDGVESNTVPSLDSSDKSKKREKGTSAGANTNHGVPKPSQQISEPKEVPKFVTPSLPKSAHAGDVVAGDPPKDSTAMGLNPEFNESSTTMTESVITNMSRKDGHTASTASISASYSTNTSKRSHSMKNMPTAANVEKDPLDRSASDRSAPKSAKVAPSQPYDLSKLLDDLWENPNSVANPTKPVRALRTSARSTESNSDSSDSGVYTAGFTSYYSSEGFGENSDVAAQGSHAARPSLSQIDEDISRIPAQQTSSRSEGHIHSEANQRGPTVESSSSSWGGVRDEYEPSRRIETAGQPSKARAASNRDPAMPSTRHIDEGSQHQTSAKPEGDTHNRTSRRGSALKSMSSYQGSGPDSTMPSIGHIDEERTRMQAPQQQTFSKSEGNIHRRPNQRGSALKSTSSYSGGGQDRNEGSRRNSDLGQPSVHHHEAAEVRVDDAPRVVDSTSRPRSKSRGKSRERRDHDTPSRASKFHARQEGGHEDMINNMPTLSCEDEENDGVHDEHAMAERHTVTFSSQPPRKHSMRDLLSTVESERSLSVYEDISVDGGYDPTPTKTNPHPMNSISENDGDCASVTSSVPEYKIDAEISEFARQFVNQFSKHEDKQKQSQASVDSKKPKRQDGSDRAVIEEKHTRRASTSRNEHRRASMEKEVQGKLDRRLAKSQSLGKNRLHPADIDLSRLHPHDIDPENHSRRKANQAARSKSMKVKPESNLLDEDDKRQSLLRSKSEYPSADPQSHSQRQASQMGRSKSMKVKPQSNIINEDDYAENSRPSATSKVRPPSHGRRRSHDNGKHHGKYSIGDYLRSENDVMHDNDINQLLRLEVFDHVFVRRSGGRWSYSTVIEVGHDHIVFVLNGAGSKKTIEHSSLLHNVRRLNHAECFPRNK